MTSKITLNPISSAPRDGTIIYAGDIRYKFPESLIFRPMKWQNGLWLEITPDGDLELFSTDESMTHWFSVEEKEGATVTLRKLPKEENHHVPELPKAQTNEF